MPEEKDALPVDRGTLDGETPEGGSLDEVTADEESSTEDAGAGPAANSGGALAGWNAWVYRNFSAESRLRAREERSGGTSGRPQPRGARSTGATSNGNASNGPSTAQARSEAARVAVNGLEPLERRVGYFALIVEVALTALVVIPYLTHKHPHTSSDLQTASAVHVFLIEGLVLAAFLLLGNVLKRRALLGFASLLVGVWLIQIKVLAVMGFAYLGFGLWLVVRALKLSNPNRAEKNTARTATTRTSRSARKAGTPTSATATRSAPKPNKRYTPPKATSRPPAPKKQVSPDKQAAASAEGRKR